jgi:hypothetical protein
VSVTAIIGVRVNADGPFPQRVRISTFSSSVWLRKPGEWKPMREISLVEDEKLQKGILIRSDADIYPLYRWEVLAAEQTGPSLPEPAGSHRNL